MQHDTTFDAPPREGFLPRWLFSPWLRGFLASALTYAAAVGAAAWKGPAAFNMQINGQPAGPGDWWIVLLFTFSHAVIPVFFYRLFFLASAAQSSSVALGGKPKPAAVGCQHAFLYVHMSGWYGGPIVILGAMTSWLSLIGFAIVLCTARQGERLWAFLEYGSSSMAMVLAMGILGVQNVWGVLIVLVQSVLLGLTHVVGKKLWTAAPAARGASAAVAETAKTD